MGYNALHNLGNKVYLDKYIIWFKTIDNHYRYVQFMNNKNYHKEVFHANSLHPQLGHHTRERTGIL